MDNYEDIINLEHPEPINHPRMNIKKRAGIFAPFAALTGYDEEIAETGRETSEEVEIDDDIKEKLDRKLQIIINNINSKPKIIVTYFIKDTKKKGGKYQTKEVNIKSIDMIYNNLITTKNEIINIENIIKIEGELFNESY